MDEFARISRYFAPLAQGFAGAFGLTDDAAAFDIPQGQEIVVTTDALIEGTHFFPQDTPRSIAQRLLRRNLSDLAAMGAQPFAYTLITVLRGDITDDWLAAFSHSLKEDQQKFGCHLIGGDSTRAAGPLHFSITAFGLLPKGQALRRIVKRASSPPPHYDLYVTGTIGDSTLGLMLKQGKDLPALTQEEKDFLIARHECPEPRVEVGRDIRNFARAAIDISDGLVADVGHIAEHSQLQAILHAPLVPLSPAAKKVVTVKPALLETLLTGGEDYELVFVIDPREESMLPITATKMNVPLTKIGTLQEGTAGDIQVLDQNNRIIPLKTKGWTHF
jgi:thiamine-monophosphate kinase